jgi:hypothetical protein
VTKESKEPEAQKSDGKSVQKRQKIQKSLQAVRKELVKLLIGCLPTTLANGQESASVLSSLWFRHKIRDNFLFWGEELEIHK